MPPRRPVEFGAQPKRPRAACNDRGLGLKEWTLKQPQHTASALLLCPRCATSKPLEDFPRKGKNRDSTQRYGYCRPCHSDYQRTKKLERVFNLTVEDYDTILASQGGVCAICRAEPGKTRLAVDHDHDSGLIRGLICSACNHGLGYWKDSLERLQAAVDYMVTPPAAAALGEPRYGRKGATQDTDPKNRYFVRGRDKRTGPRPARSTDGQLDLLEKAEERR